MDSEISHPYNRYKMSTKTVLEGDIQFTTKSAHYTPVHLCIRGAVPSGPGNGPRCPWTPSAHSPGAPRHGHKPERRAGSWPGHPSPWLLPWPTNGYLDQAQQQIDQAIPSSTHPLTLGVKVRLSYNQNFRSSPFKYSKWCCNLKHPMYMWCIDSFWQKNLQADEECINWLTHLLHVMALCTTLHPTSLM